MACQIHNFQIATHKFVGGPFHACLRGQRLPRQNPQHWKPIFPQQRLSSLIDESRFNLAIPAQKNGWQKGKENCEF